MANVFSLKGRALKLDSKEDLEKHVGPLIENEDVEEFTIEGNTIGVEAAEALAKILATKKNLRDVNLADLFTGRLLSEIPQALDALLTALLNCPKLHTINLNDNAFGLNTVEPLRPFLSKHTPLQHLYLNNNGLGPQAGTLVAEALVQLAAAKDAARKSGQNVPDLETVVCGRNRLETGSMAAWAKAYTANDKVRMVKMVQNGIRQEGVTTLITLGLSKCKELDTLDLQDNTFTKVAAGALAKAIPQWTKLRDLGVGDCLLGAVGGVRLGQALSAGKNDKLQVLRLQFNEIGSKGVAALTNAANTALPVLRRVELNGNQFSEENLDIERLREKLEKNKEQHAEAAYAGLDEDDEDLWGIDELDELEDEEDEEDEDEDEDGEEAGNERIAEQEAIVKDAEAAENQPVAQDKDADVDALADQLKKTDLK